MKQHKPDIRVKYSPRVTKKVRRLVTQICRKWEMFEADVLRFCLEAIVPVAAKKGMDWVTRQIPGFDREKRVDLSAMVTVRTSVRIKGSVNRLTGVDGFTEAETLRYCYDYILPVALKEGFGKIMAMREKGF